MYTMIYSLVQGACIFVVMIFVIVTIVKAVQKNNQNNNNNTQQSEQPPKQISYTENKDVNKPANEQNHDISCKENDCDGCGSQDVYSQVYGTRKKNKINKKKDL